MRRKTKRGISNRTKSKLGLPDLEHAKSALLLSLRSPESQRSYRRSIYDFVRWYCPEPRLSFNKTVVTRYRIHLEDRLLAPGTINVRLAAVRRLACEAADTFKRVIANTLTRARFVHSSTDPGKLVINSLLEKSERHPCENAHD